MPEVNESNDESMIELTADIVSAYVSNNAVAVSDLPGLITHIHETLRDVEKAGKPSIEEPAKPAVPINRSVQKDYLICLEDGQKFKSLKRHLRTHYNLSPEEYREKWRLPIDYPMVAPSYSRARSALAKKVGLGKKRKGRKKRK